MSIIDRHQNLGINRLQKPEWSWLKLPEHSKGATRGMRALLKTVDPIGLAVLERGLATCTVSMSSERGHYAIL